MKNVQENYPELILHCLTQVSIVVGGGGTPKKRYIIIVTISLLQNVLLEEDSRSTLKRIQLIAKLANTSCHTLCTLRIVTLARGTSHTSFNFKCFNWEEFGHGIKDCKKPKDQDKIAANKEKSIEAKKTKGESGEFMNCDNTR